jgi:hypothetical protein
MRFFVWDFGREMRGKVLSGDFDSVTDFYLVLGSSDFGQALFVEVLD